MNQLPLLEIPFWTVSELTRYLRQLIEVDIHLQDLWVQGEISNLARPSSGHIYFTLKDSASALKVVIWRSTAQRLKLPLRDGLSVELHGSLGVYEVSGQYQLYADLVRPLGEGALYRQFLLLKEQLEAEGLFDPQRKRPIPTFPRRIGIVTSPTGAALRDMLNTLSRRFPQAEVILAATLVQGDEAAGKIIKALQDLNDYAKPDVILIARGGGSIEDLWAFNDPGVARAIAASAAPVISGIGHETDFTIADFAADLRASTPTAAAELAVPNAAELDTALHKQIQRLGRAQLALLSSTRWTLRDIHSQLTLHSPRARLRSAQQRLDELDHRLIQALTGRMALRRASLNGLANSLLNLNPQSILQRGYAIVSRQDKTLVRSVQNISAGERLDVQVTDGVFPVFVGELPVQEPTRTSSKDRTQINREGSTA